MTSNSSRVGRLREHGRGNTVGSGGVVMPEIPPDTILTVENDQILISQKLIIDVSNFLSDRRRWGRKLSQGEVHQLIKFGTMVRPSSYHGRTYATAVAEFAADFDHWYKTRQSREGRGEFALEEDNNAAVSGADEYSGDSAGVAEYLKREVGQFTNDESQYKFAAHQDRRGNAVIDQERVAGSRGSPNNIKSAPLSQAGMFSDIHDMSQLMASLLSPTAVDHMFNRLQGYVMNTNNITLPHMTVAFDTRNRLQNVNNYSAGPGATQPGGNFRWQLHAASYAGNLGAIRLQDSLQQIIEMSIAPFWIPVSSAMMPAINNYNTVRLFIQEYDAQAVTVAEYNDPNQTTPTFAPYHFECDVEKTMPAVLVSGQPGKAYLVPRQTFRFRRPMAKNLDTFTVVFRTPYNAAQFEPDAGYFTITYGNPTTFTVTAPTILPTLVNGDLVYIYNANPTGPQAQQLASQINNPAGNIITVTSTTEFTINIDSTSGGINQSNVLVYFASKRIFFQIKFLCLE